jgi:sarcosine oxidase subunit gamma
MSEPEFRSALAGVALRGGLAISISEITDLGMIDVRGNAKDGAFRAAFRKVLGCDVPTDPRTSVAASDNAVLWLSTDQWLALVPRRRVKDVASELRSALRDMHALAIDLSDARTIIRLEGAGVREILMKGTPVDLTLADLGPGSVRRLRFGDIAAMVHIRRLEPDVIDLFVFRSYGRFAWEWLDATAGEAARLRLFTSQPVPPTI